MYKKALAITMLMGVAVTSAQAGPMGPIKPTMGRFGLGFEISADRRDMEWTSNAADKDRAENINYLGNLSYGLTENVEIYARLGGASFDLVDLVDVNATEQTFNGSSQFAWGGGISGILYDAGTWNIGGNANYLAHSGHTGNTTPTVITNNDIDYSEWNIGLQVQGKYDQFLPYLGVKYSDATIDFNKINGAAGTADDDADNNVGVYVGAGIDLAPQWSAYLEGRFVDETSFGGGVRYTF